MQMTSQQIVQEIKAYIQNTGGAYSGWYAGITSDVEQRLFGDHGVDKKNDSWIYRTGDSSDAARNAENSLLNLGCDGDSGGGDSGARIVYAYKKNSHTNP